MSRCLPAAHCRDQLWPSCAAHREHTYLPLNVRCSWHASVLGHSSHLHCLCRRAKLALMEQQQPHSSEMTGVDCRQCIGINLFLLFEYIYRNIFAARSKTPYLPRTFGSTAPCSALKKMPKFKPLSHCCCIVPTLFVEFRPQQFRRL